MVEDLTAIIGTDLKKPDPFHTEVLVIGGGPGGYTAAFRAADLGKQVTVVEKRERLGGVCLNVGCIPSKALLHVAELINEAEEASTFGLTFAKPSVDLDGVRAFKDSVIDKLTGGLGKLADKRGVKMVQGSAIFSDSHSVEVATEEGMQRITFDNCIIAAGSEPVELPFFPKDDRIIDSTGALKLEEVPEKLLVIGGGIIGLEMATVYSALGSKVTIVELMDHIIPPADKDMIQPLQKSLKEKCEAIYVKTKVTSMEATEVGIVANFEGKKCPESDTFDKVLLSVGRRPNGGKLNSSSAGFDVTEQGFITVNEKFQTNQPHIYAIGDIIGQPMLAHKAVHEGKLAAEFICGEREEAHISAIPSVAYTSPEVAWVGLSEKEAKEAGIDYEKASIPWGACGRALAMAAENGKTKALFEKESGKLLGVHITGKNAGELIASAAVALSHGATKHTLAATIQAHPTLAETIAFASEMAEGTITDLLPPKKR